MPPPESGDGKSGAPPAALRISHLSKTFPGTRALRDVSFDVDHGTFHALLGGNGSGKSTLIKVLAGVYHGDPGGSVTVGDTQIASDKTTPEAARSLNLHFVHQHPAVFPTMSVAENIAIGTGFETTAAGSIRWRTLRQRTAALLERFNIPASPDTMMRTLRPAEQAMVAIARALQDQEGESRGVLVLDEPTASLPRAEVTRLMAALIRYARNGQTILFVSHRLDEVIGTADHATVLRDGMLAGTVSGDDITESRLIELIVGRPLDRVFPDMPEVKSDEVALEARHLAGGPLRDVSFGLRRGEVLGIAGLLGSGRSELLKMIFGAYPIKGGELMVGGSRARFRHIGEAMKAGIAYVPEDRGGEGRVLRHVRRREHDGRDRGPVLAVSPPAAPRDGRRRSRRDPGVPRAHPLRAGGLLHPLRRQPAEGGAGPLATTSARASCFSTSPRRASTSTPVPRSTRWCGSRSPTAAPCSS